MYVLQAQRSFNDFKNHRPLNADEIEGLNVFYVEAESDHDDGKQCNFGSAGVDRLLACKDWVFEGLADQHCGAGLSKTVLIIHNDDKYGGQCSALAADPHTACVFCDCVSGPRFGEQKRLHK